MKGRISQSTRERVLQIAKELGYPLTADGFRAARSRSENIGILFNRRIRSLVADPFYGRVMEGVEDALRLEGYHLLFATLSEKGEDLKKIAKFSRENRVDGLILAGCDVDLDYINAALEARIPLVLVDNNLPRPKVPCAMTDNVTGAREAVEHLVSLGHRRIAMITGPLSHSSLYERYCGYRQALEAYRLDLRPDWVISNEDVAVFDVQGGYEAARRLLTKPQRPTAIFAANDFLAVGAMQAAHEAGLDIPADLSVVGFDDVDLAAHTNPPLTTVRVYKRELGIQAAKMLLELIRGQASPVPCKVMVSTELVARESSAAMKS